MQSEQDHITDSFGRVHNYLRISLTERCNLRCFYCMPKEGIALRERSEFMSNEELLEIARVFTDLGVNKIRLTGGEPLVRKNVEHIIDELGKMPVNLAITTNAILVDRYINRFKAAGINTVNVSLDSLNRNRLHAITRKDYYSKIINNIHLLIDQGFHVKVNMVVMKGVNDDELVDFVAWTKDLPIHVRFIEFMPFIGNQWSKDKALNYAEMTDKIEQVYGSNQISKLTDHINDTTKGYKIEDYCGTFSFITSISNPFCGGCNRIRLTADGKIKNCLFSNFETDLLTPLRQGKEIKSLIFKSIYLKKKLRAGLETSEKFNNTFNHRNNRTMVAIGG